MGTTQEKFEYAFEAKDLIKQGINNLGGSITDQTELKDYADELQNIYDVLPKTAFQTGTDIAIENGLKGKIDFEKVYQEVEYIESSGTQYIDTGIVVKTNTKIEATFLETQKVGSYPKLLGSEVSNGVESFKLDVRGNFVIGYIFEEDTQIPCQLQTKYFVTFEHNYFKANTNEFTFSRTAFNGTYPIFLCASNRSGNAIEFGAIKLYSFKAYEGNTLIRDMIPCYRKSDNVIGMYDKVNNKFYTNAGTGTFTKGADVGSGFNDIVGFGQNSQESTTGTQRMDTTETIPETTKNGVTYSLKDGVFTFNGTATGSFDVYCQNKFTLEAGAYTMAPSDIKGSYTGILGKYAYVSGVGNTIDGGQMSQTMNTTLANDYTNVQCHLFVASGAVFSNYQVKINLAKGSYTSQTIPAWEQYSGGYASPSPNWGQQVKCVAGKNKCDINSKLENAIINTNSISTGIFTLLYKKLARGTYTISSSTQMQFVYCFTDNIPTTSTNNITRIVENSITQKTFNVPKDCYICYRILFYDGSTLEEVVNLDKINSEVQLEERHTSNSIPTI